MAQQQEWTEDDFDVPAGVGRMDLTEPVSGRRYIMYHGTTKKNAQSIKATGFRQSTDGMLGRGVYLSRDLQKASRYPINHPESDRAVLKVSVNVGKVITINYQGHPRQKTWHDYGFDMAWVPPKCGMVRSGLEEDCVWDPSRIEIITIINPKPVERPRPVQPSGAWGGYSSSYYSPPSYHDCCLYRPNPVPDALWMLQQFGSLAIGDTDMNQQYQWVENDPEPPSEPKRRGRPPKNRDTVPEPPSEPKPRGRPPKIRDTVPEPPSEPRPRGRPPKIRDTVPEPPSEPKPRGRPPKIRDTVPEPPSEPRPRGRPPKIRDTVPEPPSEPKRRGRPPKNR